MMNGNLSEGLAAAEFEIGGTRFKVSKLPAMAAFNLLEQIRREVGRSTSEIKANEDPRRDRWLHATGNLVPGARVRRPGAPEAV